MSLRHLNDDDFQAYLDGRPNCDTDRLERHLLECDTCREELEEYRLVFETLRQDTELSLAPGFPDRVMAAIESEPAVKPAFSLTSWLSLAAAAVVLMGLSAVQFFVGWEWLVTFNRSISQAVLSFKETLTGSTGSLPGILTDNLAVLLACGLALVFILCLEYLLKHSKPRGTHTLTI